MVIGLGLVLTGSVRAGSLPYVTDYLNRQRANQTAGEIHQIFFIPATDLSGLANSVRLVFPGSAAGTWCRQAVSNLTVTAITNPSGSTEAAELLPGTLAAGCTVGNGSTTYDTITVTGVGQLTAGVKYGVRVADGSTPTLGTPAAAAGIATQLITNDGLADVDQSAFYLTTVSQDQITVTATVVGETPPVTENPIVTFRGVGAPYGQVKVYRDEVLITSVPTDGEAAFNITLNNQPTGSHIYVLRVFDQDGHELTPLTFALNLGTGSTTLVTNIFLGPSIAIDHTSVKLGQEVKISGSTVPTGTVVLTVNSPTLSYSILSDQVGRWSKIINSNDVGVGTHTVKARAYQGTQMISEYSEVITFSVNPVGQCDGKKTADLNCDGDVGLTDFSILMYFWAQTNPSNGRADINQDQRVDVVDFSIMLYQWTA